MPELPEVETVTNALRPHLTGRTILGVKTYTAKLRYPLNLEGRPEILNQRITKVWRRGRYCLVDLESNHTILVHLGMTGSCRIVAPDEPRLKHEHVVFSLDNGLQWRYKDARKFGDVSVHPIEATGKAPACLDSLGPEPFDESFDGNFLFLAAKGKKTAIKTFIMNNAIVTGVGNIYASESLFRAGIRPDIAAGQVSRERLDCLAQHIRDVLAAAIKAGGTTIIDFETVTGEEGWFSRELQVYGRDGEACLRCAAGVIRKFVQTGRSSYYCPNCQS